MEKHTDLVVAIRAAHTELERARQTFARAAAAPSVERPSAATKAAYRVILGCLGDLSAAKDGLRRACPSCHVQAEQVNWTGHQVHQALMRLY
jgi:hypothetical protein